MPCIWIGDNLTILGKVKIGDGAIIGTGAILTKRIEPYAIVGDVPAKLIRKRFDNNKINFLMDFRWWEKDINWLRLNAKHFANIDDFVTHFSNMF